MNEENLEIKQEVESEDPSKLGRREVIKVGAAVAGGLALGMGAYVKPGIVSVGVEESYAATIEVPPGGLYGCSPGWWWDSPYGSNLWDGESPEWAMVPRPSGALPTPYDYPNAPRGDQPFSLTDVFHGPYTPASSGFAGFVAYAPLGDRQLITFNANYAPGESPAEHALFQAIAAVLNARWFGSGPGLYPFSEAQIVQMWADAVDNANGVAGATTTFGDIATALNTANNLGCPIP